ARRRRGRNGCGRDDPVWTAQLRGAGGGARRGARVLGVISFVHRGAHATGLLLVASLFAVAAARPLFAVAGCATAAVGVAGALLAVRLASARRGARARVILYTRHTRDPHLPPHCRRGYRG